MREGRKRNRPPAGPDDSDRLVNTYGWRRLTVRDRRRSEKRGLECSCRASARALCMQLAERRGAGERARQLPISRPALSQPAGIEDRRLDHRPGRGHPTRLQPGAPNAYGAGSMSDPTLIERLSTPELPYCAQRPFKLTWLESLPSVTRTRRRSGRPEPSVERDLAVARRYR